MTTIQRVNIFKAAGAMIVMAAVMMTTSVKEVALVVTMVKVWEVKMRSQRLEMWIMRAETVMRKRTIVKI